MTTKFREGDVVRVKSDATGREYTVLCVDRTFEPGSVGVRVRHVLTDFPPKSLALLRRPVRVGDVLRLEVDGPLHTVTAADLEHSAWLFGSWTHADGTPIDVPKAEASDDLGLRCATCRRAVMPGASMISMWNVPGVYCSRECLSRSPTPSYKTRTGEVPKVVEADPFAEIASNCATCGVELGSLNAVASEGLLGVYCSLTCIQAARATQGSALQHVAKLLDRAEDMAGRMSRSVALPASMVPMGDGGSRALAVAHGFVGFVPVDSRPRHTAEVNFDAATFGGVPLPKLPTLPTFGGIPLPAAAVDFTKMSDAELLRFEKALGASIAKCERERAVVGYAIGDSKPRPDGTHEVLVELGARRLPSDVGNLACVLFETDPDVIAHVRRVEDGSVPITVTRWNQAEGRCETVRAEPKRDGFVGSHVRWDEARRARLMQIAWTRGSKGKAPEAEWWKRAQERAEAMREVMGRIGR